MTCGFRPHGLLLEEVRSVHPQIGRINDRIRSLEDVRRPVKPAAGYASITRGSIRDIHASTRGGSAQPRPPSMIR